MLIVARLSRLSQRVAPTPDLARRGHPLPRPPPAGQWAGAGGARTPISRLCSLRFFPADSDLASSNHGTARTPGRDGLCCPQRLGADGNLWGPLGTSPSWARLPLLAAVWPAVHRIRPAPPRRGGKKSFLIGPPRDWPRGMGLGGEDATDCSGGGRGAHFKTPNNGKATCRLRVGRGSSVSSATAACLPGVDAGVGPAVRPQHPAAPRSAPTGGRAGNAWGSRERQAERSRARPSDAQRGDEPERCFQTPFHLWPPSAAPPAVPDTSDMPSAAPVGTGTQRAQPGPSQAP